MSDEKDLSLVGERSSKVPMYSPAHSVNQYDGWRDWGSGSESDAIRQKVQEQRDKGPKPPPEPEELNATRRIKLWLDRY